MSENQIIAAGTVDELMQILDSPPYSLSAPRQSDFPDRSPPYILWGLKIAVTKDGASTYTARVEEAWDVIEGLVQIKNPTFSVTLPGSE